MPDEKKLSHNARRARLPQFRVISDWLETQHSVKVALMSIFLASVAE